MEPWRAVYSHNGGLEAKTEALEGLQTNDHRSYHFEEELGPDLNYM
jgi:hypothetical protein